MIMLTNNTSDIEKDRQGGRKTLAVCIGRRAAQRLLRGSIFLSAAAVVLIVLLRFPLGTAALPVLPLAFAIIPQAGPFFTAPISAERRSSNMAAILKIHIWINSAYAAAVILSCAAV